MSVIILYIFNTVLPILLLLLLSSFVHVFVHECGHAIPVLAISGTRTTIYIGSYGDSAQSFRFRIGRVKVRIKKNPFLWFRGMCKYGGAYFSINQQIWFVLAGPLASLLVGILATGLLETGAFPGFLRFWLGFIVLFAGFGLLGSIVPSGRQMHTHDGVRVYPDLIAAVRLWRSKRLAWRGVQKD